MSPTTDNFRLLLERWLARTARSQELHYKAAHEATDRNRKVGLLGIGLGLIVALNSLYPPSVAIVVPVLAGVGAAYASAAQMLFRWADQAEGYKSAAVQMGQIRRNIEQVLASAEVVPEKAADQIREEVNLVLPHVPRIPFDFFQKDSN